MSTDWESRITINPAILAGKPVIRGLRISVEHVLRALAGGVPAAEFLAEYPELQPEDLSACLAYAAEVIGTDRVYPIRVGA